MALVKMHLEICSFLSLLAKKSSQTMPQSKIELVYI